MAAAVMSRFFMRVAGEVGGVYAEPPLLQLWAAAKAVFATAEGGQDNVPLVA